MMKHWVLKKWRFGFMEKYLLTGKFIKVRSSDFILKSIFHYSIIPLFHAGGIFKMPLKAE